MAVDDGRGPEQTMPVGGALGAAPLRELGVPQDICRVAYQREMVHQDGRQVLIAFGESRPGMRDPCL